MGWAKYDEDIRELIEERQNDSKLCYTTKTTQKHHSEVESSNLPQINRTANRSSCYIKFSTGILKF